MKFNKIICVTGASILMASTVLSACSGKQESVPASTAASEAAETTKAAEETTAGVTAELNFEYADFLSESREFIISKKGEPSSENTEVSYDDILEYADTQEAFHVYAVGDEANEGREDECWYIESTAGRVFNMSVDSIPKEQFLTLINSEGDPVDSVNEVAGDFIVGDIGQSIMTYECEGYLFTVALDDDGNVTKDSRIAMCTIDVNEADGN